MATLQDNIASMENWIVSDVITGAVSLTEAVHSFDANNVILLSVNPNKSLSVVMIDPNTNAPSTVDFYRSEYGAISSMVIN